MRSNRIRTRAAILVGALAFVATACGGSDAASPTTTATTATVAASVTSTTGAIVSPQSASTVAADGPDAPGTTSPASTSSQPAPTKSILQLAAEEGSLTTMLHLLDVAGLTTTLEGDGPFTLIAPTEAAFAKMDPDTLDSITKNPTVLKQLLDYHIINGRVSKKDLLAGGVTSAEGSSIA
ncbi:MAG: fasciclin domain-containing protein, partial [Ilumatobacteraceae bacterium]